MQDDSNLLSAFKSEGGDNHLALDPQERRRRPKPGERRDQILQALASMLEQPGGERITTAALAARLHVSEAALYRHFASKAQMFEGLIDFIEQTLFTLIQRIEVTAQPDPLDNAVSLGTHKAKQVVAVVLQFAEKNPGMARVMVGDALVLENERLQQRMNRLFDKIESSLKLCLREGSLNSASDTPTVDAQVSAAVLVAFVSGCLQRYVRSGYLRTPSDHLKAALAQMLG